MCAVWETDSGDFSGRSSAIYVFSDTRERMEAKKE